MSKRADAVGLFWQDFAKEKPLPKEKIKRAPPPRFWESPCYLPDLQAAIDFKPDLFNDIELWQASIRGERLLYDIEVYPNYCLFAFKSYDSGKVVTFRLADNDPFDEDPILYVLDIPKLRWVLENFCIINFNGRKYDFPVTTLALAGYSSQDLWDATCMIIVDQLQAKDVYKQYKTKPLEINQIDLIELTALGPGLKVCAGRLHARKLQDLPFKPGTILTRNQIYILDRYCVNDLDNTGLLFKATTPQIELRESTGKQFKLDLRSHSDAQMAEAIISSEIKRLTGRKFLTRTKLEPGTWYTYKTPSFIKYQSELMNYVLKVIQSSVFRISHLDGTVIVPDELKALVIEMGKSKYKFGIGGLHSQEENIAHVSDDEYVMIDTDVTSYYPYTIINAGLYPQNLGQDFIVVYKGVVQRRVTAKQAGDIIVAECLKIVANGTFGKLGSMWSVMYAPNLMLQVTITGQLSILMLAERLELAGIEVTSINTDGIIVKCPRLREAQFHEIVNQWEKDTGLSTEETRYKATYSKDINNYIAVYETPQKGELFKMKGLYSKTNPKKNAVNEICIDALKALITTRTLPAETIRNCKDLRKFTSMRNVAGGAVKMFDENTGVYLGKLIRWYYATGENGEIIYAKNGNKVARTEGAKPCMDLPDSFPDDIDYDWYINETYKILDQIGYTAAHS